MQPLLHIFESHSYAGIFVGLMLCSLGLPLPEETFLIAGGLLVHGGSATFPGMVATAMGAILLGDSLAFWLGRAHAHRASRIPLLRKFLGTEPQRERLRRHFDAHAFKTLFAARFVPGLRAPTFFFAAGHGVTWRRFLAVDLVAGLVSVPTSIWIAWYLGENQQHARRVVHEFELWLLVAVVLAVGGFAFVLWRRRRRKQLADADPPIARPGESGPGATSPRPRAAPSPARPPA